MERAANLNSHRKPPTHEATGKAQTQTRYYISIPDADAAFFNDAVGLTLGYSEQAALVIGYYF